MTELCVIHPGGLSALCWPRLAKHLPTGTKLRVLELEAVNAFWEQDPALTVDGLADRLRLTLDPRQERVLAGWGFGGVVAEALAGRLGRAPRRTVLLDAAAPGTPKPSRAELLRTYAMLVGARRGRPLPVDPERLGDGLEAALEHLREAAARTGAVRDGTTVELLRRGYHEHARARLYQHRLTARHTVAGVPVTVVRAARSVVPDGVGLGWNAAEELASGGDHYTMLTEPAPSVHLALALARWMPPARAAA